MWVGLQVAETADVPSIVDCGAGRPGGMTAVRRRRKRGRLNRERMNHTYRCVVEQGRLSWNSLLSRPEIRELHGKNIPVVAQPEQLHRHCDPLQNGCNTLDLPLIGEGLYNVTGHNF